MARLRAPLLLLTVLVISTAGLVYELLAGALASSRLGDSVTQFSITIGVYLFAMGIGAYLSKFIDKRLPERFVEIELATALVGGFEAPILWVANADDALYRVALYGLLGTIGTLVGLEIPLLMRILKESEDIRELVAKVLSVDYLGALIGSLLFALVLLPTLGMIRTSLLFGLLNAGVALLSTFVLADSLHRFARARLRGLGVLITIGLTAAFVYSSEIELWGEQDLYGGRVLLARQSPYQRIVLSEGRGTVQLYLNGHLQFSSADEHRYHEALVHPAFSAAREHRRVLVLGGGDGLAVREVLRYPEVDHVTLVDLDPMMTELARRTPILSALNSHALDDPRVEIINDDAMVWIDEYRGAPFDIMIIDFPDPNSYSLGRLYTSRFYSLAARALASGGAMVVQSTSPLMARYSYWCIVRSMRAAGLHVAPYHALVPSFGEWGYALARAEQFAPPTTLRVTNLRFLNAETLSAMFSFSEDMSEVDAEVNRLNDQLLVRYYDAEWSRYE